MTVLNGVGTKGIARKTAELLRGLRFTDGTPRYNVTDVGDADNYDYTETQILVNHPGRELPQGCRPYKKCTACRQCELR